MRRKRRGRQVSGRQRAYHHLLGPAPLPTITRAATNPNTLRSRQGNAVGKCSSLGRRYAGVAAAPLRPAGRTWEAAAAERPQKGGMQASSRPPRGHRPPAARGRARAPAAPRSAQAHSSDRYRGPDVGRRADRWRPGGAGRTPRGAWLLPRHGTPGSLTPPACPVLPSPA